MAGFMYIINNLFLFIMTDFSYLRIKYWFILSLK